MSTETPNDGSVLISSNDSATFAGRQRRGRLVEHHDLRLRDERPGESQLLALAARQAARIGAPPLVERRKALEHLIDAAAIVSRHDDDLQIFEDRQRAEHIRDLRHVADAETRAPLGRLAQ